ncbi:hypothetical protein B0T10DRAFT_550357 [Thelonectria olida]|uniref:Chromo domain-containing protein n=1 Tax=Thelonectria olida TaxID=1576542 RepID=A0A9P8VZ76_9HYPO|nr:hypothetical protein B0T10DRAFT_550357 [Thelonectria olida]
MACRAGSPKSKTVFLHRETSLLREELPDLLLTPEGESHGSYLDDDTDHMMVISGRLAKGKKAKNKGPFTSSAGEEGTSTSKRPQSPVLSEKEATEETESKATSTPRKRQRRSSANSDVTPRRSSRLAVILHVKDQHAPTGAVKKRGRGRPPKAKKPEQRASQPEWEVEKIVQSQIDAHTQEHFYRVKWRGYAAKFNTWEPKKNLAHCRKAIQDFEKGLKKKKR